MDILKEAIAVIAEVSGKDPGSIDKSMDLVANLGLDSAKALELLVKLEDRLNVEIDEEAATGLNTVGDILDYLGGLTT